MRFTVFRPESPVDSKSGSAKQLNSLPITEETSNQLLEIEMYKHNGTLGFTLRKEQNSYDGHFISALVQEPAVSDGRIFVGDQVVKVNNISIESMSHEDAVQVLRNSGNSVILRLRRKTTPSPELYLNEKRSHLRYVSFNLLKLLY